MRSDSDGAISTSPPFGAIGGGQGDFKPETFTPDELLRAAEALIKEADGRLTYIAEEVILSAGSNPRLWEGLKAKARERRNKIAEDLGFGPKTTTVVGAEATMPKAPVLEMVRPPKPETNPADVKTVPETIAEEPVVNEDTTLREAINMVEDRPILLDCFCQGFKTRKSAVWVLVALRGLFIYLREPYVQWATNQRTPDDSKEECEKVIGSFEACLISIAEILTKLGLDPRTREGRKQMQRRYFLGLDFQEEIKVWFRNNGFRLTLLYPRDYLLEIEVSDADAAPDPRWEKVRPGIMQFGGDDRKGPPDAYRQKKAERRARDVAKRVAMRGASNGSGSSGKKGKKK